jgi:hypothetical protein
MNLMSCVQMKRKLVGHCNDVDPATPNVPYQRIPELGQSLGPHVEGDFQASGTLGLYLTVNGSRNLLTCNHVAFPEFRSAKG